MTLWGIATETRIYAADDISGKGAATNPGRWNDEGQPLVYAALTISLAVLETAAHIDDAGLPLNRYVVRIEVPDQVWEQRDEQAIGALPAAWSAIPAGRASVAIGSAWLSSERSPILLVPSVIVPEEWVALVNPLHPASRTITARAMRSFEYGRLFMTHAAPR